MNSKPLTLTKVEIKVGVVGWVAVKIEIKGQTISVALNKNTIIKEFVDENILKEQGTFMFGINGTTASFANIKSTSLMSEE